MSTKATFITINNIKEIRSLKVFEEDGWAFLKYFPTATVVGLGCMEKQYKAIYPQVGVFNP